MNRILPVICDEGGHYRKFEQVHARPAAEGEVIVSITADGEETRNTAKNSDWVVKNLTAAQEEYILGEKEFARRYTEIGLVDSSWKLYDSKGEIRAIEITQGVTCSLDVDADFQIMAPWGSEQVAREGDYLVSPLPELDQVYRIGRPEFEQTYEPA